mgnify:FL=1
MSHFGSYSDDFYVNMHLNTEMELPSNRDAVLHFFEQLQKYYPTMRNFYGRERGEYVLEEDKDLGYYRWATVEPKRVSSGYVNPAELQVAIDQCLNILDLVPHTLSMSPLDCESLNIMYGFDYTYRGNQNEVVAETLGLPPAFAKLNELPEASLLCQEPNVQFSLDSDCRTQVRIGVETRTTAYHIRNGEFPEEQLSVYLTVRRYGSLDPGETYVSAIQQLAETCQSLMESYLIENILLPLKQRISIQ